MSKKEVTYIHKQRTKKARRSPDPLSPPKPLSTRFLGVPPERSTPSHSPNTYTNIPVHAQDPLQTTSLIKHLPTPTDTQHDSTHPPAWHHTASQQVPNQKKKSLSIRTSALAPAKVLAKHGRGLPRTRRSVDRGVALGR